MDEIERIGAPDYVATQHDVLLTRVRTSGIVTEKYTIEGTEFEMYDVGGQRNERKKWIHCFENVTAVIFVAALSEYNQSLYEDSTTNRMVEALQLFEDVCSKTYFENSPMILFLNKRDLFAEKIQRVSIKSVPDFADFDGPDHDEAAVSLARFCFFGTCVCLEVHLVRFRRPQGINYFIDKFKALKEDIYVHTTCATDTENVRFVWNACKDIILKANLKDSGFM